MRELCLRVQSSLTYDCVIIYSCNVFVTYFIKCTNYQIRNELAVEIGYCKKSHLNNNVSAALSNPLLALRHVFKYAPIQLKALEF